MLKYSKFQFPILDTTGESKKWMAIGLYQKA